MFELKEKLINSSLVKGKKPKSEKALRVNVKNFNRLNKKSSMSLIKFRVGQSYFVFNATRKDKNGSYFYLSKSRLCAAIKESRNYIEKMDAIPQIVKEKQEQVLLNKKFLYYYRWHRNVK